MSAPIPISLVSFPRNPTNRRKVLSGRTPNSTCSKPSMCKGRATRVLQDMWAPKVELIWKPSSRIFLPKIKAREEEVNTLTNHFWLFLVWPLASKTFQLTKPSKNVNSFRLLPKSSSLVWWTKRNLRESGLFHYRIYSWQIWGSSRSWSFVRASKTKKTFLTMNSKSCNFCYPTPAPKISKFWIAVQCCRVITNSVRVSMKNAVTVTL